MSSIETLLSKLRKKEIKLWLEGESLRFKAPKGVMNSQLKAEIKLYKSEIIALLQENNSTSYPPIPKIQRNQELPLSFAQERLWFINQLEGANPVYNLYTILQLEGQLNVQALEKAIAHLEKRHESLRTNFKQKEGKPYVTIHQPQADVTLSTVSLENLEQTEQEIENLIDHEIVKTFDLEKDRLIRFSLLKISPQQHILIILMHHIISDGWSMEILTKELSLLYQAYSQNISPNLTPLPIQYVDFAVWQRQYFREKIQGSQLEYWQQQLQEIPPILSLPLDKPRPQIQTFKGATQKFTLSQDLTNQLKLLTQKNKVTLFLTILSAYSVLLSRYSNQKDILIGCPLANRNYQAIEGLIGFFVNSLPLRIKLDDNLTFSQLLAQVKQITLDANEHQDFPLDKLVQELKIERSLSHNPLFQVMFAWENIPQFDWQLPGLKIKTLEREINIAKFDLTLFVQETERELKGEINFNIDLLEANTIKRMIGHLQTLLAAIVINPDTKISQLPLLTPEEKHQILWEWNNTTINYPHHKCIHQLFEEQVKKTPDAIALVWEKEQLTYQQLNEKANQLTHYLQKIDVKPGTLVGICGERSLEMIIGLLGILKAGAAYVPLDPNYPPERLNFMLEDTGISILLTTQSLKNKSFTNNPKIINLINNKKINLSQKNNLDLVLKSDNLAYIIYTSGSTGKPKGVLVPHHAVNRLVCNTNYIEINSSDNIAHIANNSFDASTFEIWGALLNGSTLTLFSSETILQIELFVNQLQEKEISIIFITTALFNKIAILNPQAFTSLKYVLFGGEKVQTKWVREVYEKGCPQKLIHVYGPTENTTFSTWYWLKELSKNINNLPIGSPISNTTIYLLDSNLQPVPIGVIGEIYLGGEGLAKGYLNRKQLTAEKFIANPFDSGKLYKTGDLGRYLPDGNIKFIGRIDHQVKIRGFRIELGEIETILNQHRQVKDAIVLLQENLEKDKYLVAYVVAEENQKPEIRELRQFLQQKLPEYMIPSAFIFLDALPLTANGKINRQALPLADLTVNRQNKFMAPRTQTEATLVNIWQEILGIEKVGINDNFFELGGNSILTMRLVYQIEKELKIKVPIKSLFQLSTIKKLAEIIENEQSSNYETCTLPEEKITKNYQYPQLNHNEKLGLLASTTASKRVSHSSLLMLEKKGDPQKYKPLFFVYLLGELAENLPDYLPVYHLMLWTKVEKPETFIKALANYFVEEILKIQPNGPYYLGGYCAGGLVALEIAQQLTKKGKEVANLSLVQTSGPDPVYIRYQNLLERFGYKIYANLITNWRIILRLKGRERLNYIANKINLPFQKNNQISDLIDQELNGNPLHRNNPQSPLTSSKNEIEEQEILASLRKSMDFYQPQPYSGKVALFFSTEGGVYSLFFPKAGWHNLLKGEVSIDLVPGNHTSILRKPYVELLSKSIMGRLKN